MEITKEIFLFWETVEVDLKVKIPTHMKNILRFVQYSGSLYKL